MDAGDGNALLKPRDLHVGCAMTQEAGLGATVTEVVLCRKDQVRTEGSNAHSNGACPSSGGELFSGGCPHGAGDARSSVATRSISSTSIKRISIRASPPPSAPVTSISPTTHPSVANLVARLKAADGLILVFPQWWFNFPAILKGFFDRVLAPGVAFSHDASGGRILPRLSNIELLWALTTTGSPWWIVQLYMGNPVAASLAARHRAALREAAELPPSQLA